LVLQKEGRGDPQIEIPSMVTCGGHIQVKLNLNTSREGTIPNIKIGHAAMGKPELNRGIMRSNFESFRSPILAAKKKRPSFLKDISSSGFADFRVSLRRDVTNKIEGKPCSTA